LNETFEVFEGFKIGRQVNRNVKYADDLVGLSKNGALLQGMTESIHGTGRFYGMETNVEKIKVMRISRKPTAIQTTGTPGCATVCYAMIHNKNSCENRRSKTLGTCNFFLKAQL
jgi:hypothetical protein